MVLGVVMTALNLILEHHPDSRAGADPRVRRRRFGDGDGDRVRSGSGVCDGKALARRFGRVIPSGRRPGSGLGRHPLAIPVRPRRESRIAMNVGGALIAFIGSVAQSAAAQAAYAVSYSQLFSLITWTSLGLMGATAAVAGQNLGAGKPDRAEQAAHVAASIGSPAPPSSECSFSSSRSSCSPSSDERSGCRRDRDTAPADAQRLRSLYHRRFGLHGRSTGDWRHQESAIHFDSLYRSSCRWASASSSGRPANLSRSISGSPFS